MAYTYLSPARMKAQIRARKAGVAYKKKMAKRKWKTVTNIKVNMNTTAGMNLVSSAIKSGVMRTEKQKQASRKNLEKARAAKKRKNKSISLIKKINQMPSYKPSKRGVRLSSRTGIRI